MPFEVGALFGFWAWPMFSTLEGAADCMVVKVVVRDCSEPWGEEKVLPPLTKLLPPVSAFEREEWTVSGSVATVGAVDLLLFSTPCRCPAAVSSTDVQLSFDRLVAGVDTDRLSSGAGASVLM